jgi:hypothetical protein
VNEGCVLNDFLQERPRLIAGGISQNCLDRIESFRTALEKAASGDSHIALGQVPGASEALNVLTEQVDFHSYFASFQSPRLAEASMAVLASFEALLRQASIPLDSVEQYLANLDTMRGLPEHECIRVTSVFRAKGLEWDHVILPEVIEGQLPNLRSSETLVEDTEHPERSQDRTEAIESERRLFYVAITRARQTVSIFTEDTKRNQPSRFIYEALPAVTADSVNALTQALAVGTLSEDGLHMLRGGAREQVLHHGLMNILELALKECRDRQPLIERMMGAIGSVRPRPFQYPASFRPAPAEPRQRTNEDAGLPF